MELFNSPRKLNFDGADVTYHPQPDLGLPADTLFERLLEVTPWEQRSITIQGRQIPQPRLVAWHGSAAYGYSGLKLQPHAWNDTLNTMRKAIEEITGATFNSVLLNLYRNGRDSVGMHADDERELGKTPTIASISLGAERVFDMQPKKGGPVRHIPLAHGSMIIMAGDTQRNWKHGIAKVREQIGPRINLTFRKIEN